MKNFSHHYSYVVNAVTYTWKYTSHVVPEDFALPADSVKTVSCPALVERPDTVAGKMPVVTDACGNTLTPVFVSGGDIPACEGDVEYTYKYRDCQGHEHLWHFRYTIEAEEFTITEPSGGSTVECLSAATMPTAPAVCRFGMFSDFQITSEQSFFMSQQNAWCKIGVPV